MIKPAAVTITKLPGGFCVLGQGGIGELEGSFRSLASSKGSETN